jgi:septal ring factor EnvC (AmiA/AmiB activator)
VLGNLYQLFLCFLGCCQAKKKTRTKIKQEKSEIEAVKKRITERKKKEEKHLPCLKKKKRKNRMLSAEYISQC